MGEVKNYCGNRKPYICAIYCKADAEQAQAAMRRMSDAGFLFYAADKTTASGRKKIAKAAAALVFISGAAVEDASFREAQKAASEADLPLLTVWLERTELTPGMAMQLGTNQGIMKYDFADQEAFYAKLCAAPTLSALSVTTLQKRAAKRSAGGFAAALAAVILLAAAVWIFNPLQYFDRIKADTLPGRLGLAGLPRLSVTTLYLYGEQTQPEYRLTDMYLGKSAARQMFYYDTGETLPCATLSDLSEIAELESLERLSVAGNNVTDITPLYKLEKLKLLDLSANMGVDISGIAALKNLEVLNLSNTDIEDLSPLLGCESLKTLYLSADLMYSADSLNGEQRFEIIYVGKIVKSYEQLKAASLDPSVFSIFMAADITVPVGETLTIAPKVALGGRDFALKVEGDLILKGISERGMSNTEVLGSLTVADGGLYCGGMCSTENRGVFTVQKGGELRLERGHGMRLQEGVLDNEGIVYLRDGGSLRGEGGDLINNGEIVVEGIPGEAVHYDFPRTPDGNGKITYIEGE